MSESNASEPRTEHEPRAGEWYSDAGEEFEVVSNHGASVEVKFAFDDEITFLPIELFRDGSVVPA